MKVAVVGAGYVGLVSGACLSQTGNDVTIADVDVGRIAMLEAGEMPLYEPGLEELIARNREAGRLAFTTDVKAAGARAEVAFLAVGTPSLNDGHVDMRGMYHAVRQLAAAIRDGIVLAVKSTVPCGTHERVRAILARAGKKRVEYVANPEFLKEGSAVADFQSPDRIILGISSERALKVMRHLYAPFMRRSDRMLVMDPASAELTKYACNAMLAVRVTFMNEMARLCERVGADIEQVRRGMGADPRIGHAFLFPSLGFGGSCLPKDVRALIRMGHIAREPLRIMDAVDRANREQPDRMFRRIRAYFRGRLAGKTFAVWGLAFKAKTDDVRESPALDLVRRLVGAGAAVAAHDPKAMRTARAVLGDRHIRYADDSYRALQGAHGLIVCTEWEEYRTPDFGRIKALLAEPVIFDGRNLYDLAWMAETGIRYISLGRPPAGQGRPRHGGRP